MDLGEDNVFYSRDGIIVRQSVYGDIVFLAHRLRDSDKHEIWASHNHEPLEALKICLNDSIICLSIENKGEVVAMFGLSSEQALGSNGIIWLLASDGLGKIKRRFLRHSKRFINDFLMYYPYLENWVHINNKESIEWLKWCGATIESPRHYGIEKEPFRHFYFKRN